MDEQVLTRRRHLVWLAIIIAAVARMVAILTGRRRRQWFHSLLPGQRPVAPPPPIRLHGLTEANAFDDDWLPLMGYPTTYPIVFERNEPGTIAGLRVSGLRVRTLWFARQTS
jgi:hypothetical protein